MADQNVRVRDEYVQPRLGPATLDIGGQRQSILRALVVRLADFEGTVLDIGCGYMPYRSLLLAPPSRAERYIGLDLPGTPYGSPDLAWDGRSIPLAGNSINSALATEVLEHCTDPELLLREACRVLKPGGLVFFTGPFLWPLHDVPHDECRYTPFALARHLKTAGFGRVQIEALGGWDASLAQMIGLWVRRRPMSPRRRAILSRALTPIVRYFSAIDRTPRAFGESCMITGLAGTGVKGGE